MRHTCKGLLLLALLNPHFIKAQDINQRLLSAAFSGDTATVQALLDAGADVNAKSNAGWTALFYAAESGHTATVQALLDAGADVSAKNNLGWTALMGAAINGHAATVRALLGGGAQTSMPKTAKD